ncbi:hypothetical protein ACIHCQ_42375 [Streptomyces sp. NPDC052236]|uniref:hypothetical protein n=1 Tax=Streptomyces sp. NPDC052236 TaxID=3365686 RepID=UPI0037D32E25
MARRHDIEKILNELGEVRRVLDDPAIGLAAFHQDQEELRRKVLETVALGTTGLREENRELRRRQEKMLGDLADTRTSVEALRREIAQAWAHTVGVPNPEAAGFGVTTFELPRQELRLLEGGTASSDSNGWGEEAVREDTGPADEGDGEREEQHHGQQHQGEIPAARPDAETSVPAPPSPAPETPPVETAAASLSDEAEERRKTDRHRHVDGVLSAAAIASARLICHRDTWAFLIEQTSQHPHFRLPDRISDLDDGQIETFLSGRSLLAVLVTMRKIRDDHLGSDEDMATWALASAVYQRTLLAVNAAKLTLPEGSEVTTIVLDDRPAPDAAA